MESSFCCVAKVLHFIHEGSGGGGATLSLTYFPRYQPEFETVAITGRAGTLASRLRASGVRTHALPLDRPLRCTLSIPWSAWVIFREKPDVVIVHGQWGGFGGAVAAALAGVRKIIYYTHMPSFYTDWDTLRIWRNRIAESITCSLATRIICPSQANRYQYLLRKLASETRLVHIPNGLELARYGPSPDRGELRRSLALPENVPLVVSVGRLSDQKHVDWLLRAWSFVMKKYPMAELIIVGDGDERARLEALSAHLGLARVRFLGVQPEGYRYFQAADVAVITTMFEAQPYALLEAMACGCAVVGTAADGVAETIKNGVTGIAVMVADPEGLAGGIGSLLDSPDKTREMGLAAREEIKARYGLDQIVSAQKQIVRDVLKD